MAGGETSATTSLSYDGRVGIILAITTAEHGPWEPGGSTGGKTCIAESSKMGFETHFPMSISDCPSHVLAVSTTR